VIIAATGEPIRATRKQALAIVRIGGAVMTDTVSNWHKRHALTLGITTPDNANDALLVLEAAREIVERFLMQSRSNRVPIMW
jgi:hypothetical protein